MRVLDSELLSSSVFIIFEVDFSSRRIINFLSSLFDEVSSLLI